MKVASGDGFGTLSIACTSDPAIDESGAPQATAAVQVPAGETFTLTLTDSQGAVRSWPTVAAFVQENPPIRMGGYTLTVAHGNPDAEGLLKPYYTASESVTIQPRRDTPVSLTARIGNSQVVVRATAQFLAYFHEAKFTVKTASNNEFTFTPAAVPANLPVYVKAATTIKVTGTARRQSPTDTGKGPEVTFGEQTLAATTPRTCHIFTYDAKDAGSATLTITLGEEYTETRTLDMELNDGADYDK